MLRLLSRILHLPLRVGGQPDIVLVQDHAHTVKNFHKAGKALKKLGIDTGFADFSGGKKLLSSLQSLGPHDKAPRAYILDVVGAGAGLAISIYDWHTRNRPGQEPPQFYFASLSHSMSVGSARLLRCVYPELRAGFIDPDEFEYTARTISQYPWSWKPKDLPVSNTFRELLESTLGARIRDHDISPESAILDAELDLPPDPYERAQAMNILVRMDSIKSDFALASLQHSTDEIIGIGLSTATQNISGIDLPQAAVRFYEHAGSVFAGPVVFNLDDIDRVSSECNGLKPALVMQAYDPRVVPMMSSGRLGGVIALSPYMAAHLKFLCDSYGVAGLFGHVESGFAGLAQKFDEEKRPETDPYIQGDSITLDGHTLRRGQVVVMGLDGHGLSADCSSLCESQIGALNNDTRLDQAYRTARTFVTNVSYISERFSRAAGQRCHAVKMNLDSVPSRFTNPGLGIGLVRSEQLFLAQPESHTLLSDLWAGNALADPQGVTARMSADYEALAICSKSVRFRLFDFSPAEVVGAEEQQAYAQRYGCPAVRGGDAISTWPNLYAAQVAAIASASCRMHGNPCEILVPAVRTGPEMRDARTFIMKNWNQPMDTAILPRVGAMVETVSCCDNLESVLESCDFISIGTNDLTEDLLGIRRGDFIARSRYAAEHGFDPFTDGLAPEVTDRISDIVTVARAYNPDMQVDICGAQAARPEIARMLCDMGIDNISVAPSMSSLVALPLQLARHHAPAAPPAMQP